MIGKNLIAAAGNGISTVAVAEAIDFDGTNDYLGRSFSESSRSAMTFSAWVWPTNNGGVIFRNRAATAANEFNISITDAGVATFKVTTGNQSKYALVSNKQLALYSWNNILFSFQAGVGRLLINDVTISLMSYPAGEDIKPLLNGFDICLGESGNLVGARVSNVFLDYTYRDLSNVTNRRLFVTADLKPALGQASLNPILYLPLNDPTAPGANAGTGGNFTLTGTVARSGRGPNQYNAPYSDLDGSADYLNRTIDLTGAVDGNKATISFCFNLDAFTSSTREIFALFRSSSFGFYVRVNSSGQLQSQGLDASNNSLFDVTFLPNGGGAFVANKNYIFTFSVDLSNVSLRHAYINGLPASATWGGYTNGNMDFTTNPVRVGADWTGQARLDGRLGAVWFNTSYIDLSVPANLAKFVTGTGIDAKPVDLGATGQLPTDSSPLIYLPMYGNDAGRNYGTGGNFTVNSGPFTGSRGPNEWWGNRANFNTSASLVRSASLGLSDSATFSLSTFALLTNSGTGQVVFSANTASTYRLRIAKTGSNLLEIETANSSGVRVLDYISSSSLSSSAIHLAISFNRTLEICRVFVNGVQLTGSVTTGAGTLVNLTLNSNYRIGARGSGVEPIASGGYLSEFYFTTEYIDFSQEANRLKFRDAFGNPVDLTQQIEDGAIPNPAIYMRFPPTAFGTNYGTGGDFSISGTLTDGGQL
jgi:hypothetical protein